MDFLVGLQRPHCQFRVAVSTADSLTETVPEGKSLPCHPYSVGLFQVDLNHATWLSFHAYRIVHIGT